MPRQEMAWRGDGSDVHRDLMEGIIGRMAAGMAMVMLRREVVPGDGVGEDGREVSGDVMEMHFFRGPWAGIAGIVMGM